MPVQKQKSGLAGKLGEKGKQIHEARKADETTMAGGGSDLPAGIESGIAQVVDCKFSQYKEGDLKGEYFFYARAIVKEPTEVRGIPVRGLSTQIGPEPICDTPKSTGKRKTIEDHYAWALNELRKLGVNTAEIGFDDVEACAAAVKEAKPHTRFRTWKGARHDIEQKNGQWVVYATDEAGKKGDKPVETFKTEAAAKAKYPYAGRDSRVQHDWRGACEYGGETASEVEDNTGGEAAVEETFPDEVVTEETTQATSLDFDTLIEAANGGDEDAQKQLQAAALEAGASQEDVDNAPDWSAVANLAQAQATEEEQPAEETPFKPAVREVYFFKPTVKDAKSGKLVKAKKSVECEVKAVDEKGETVNLLNLDDKKTQYKGVKWADLESGN